MSIVRHVWKGMPLMGFQYNAESLATTLDSIQVGIDQAMESLWADAKHQGVSNLADVRLPSGEQPVAPLLLALSNVMLAKTQLGLHVKED